MIRSSCMSATYVHPSAKMFTDDGGIENDKATPSKQHKNGISYILKQHIHHWQFVNPCAHESNRHTPKLGIVRRCPASKKMPAGINCFCSIALAWALLERIGVINGRLVKGAGILLMSCW